MLAQGFGVEAGRSGFSTNKGFAGFSDFDEEGSYDALFARFLVSPGRRHLVMCHPGLVDDELRRLDPVVGTREQELAYILSGRFRRELDRKGASLVRLSSFA